MAEYREIIIEWYDASQIQNHLQNQFVQDQYLYCVYCDSHIYGRDVLAYIGKTTNHVNRKAQHFKSFFSFVPNARFVIGFFKETQEELEVAESILIANHKPFYNKEFIHDLCKEAKSEKIIVINNGKHGMLKNAVTNYWWCTEKEFAESSAIVEK